MIKVWLFLNVFVLRVLVGALRGFRIAYVNLVLHFLGGVGADARESWSGGDTSISAVVVLPRAGGLPFWPLRGGGAVHKQGELRLLRLEGVHGLN